ncbi:MAG: transposase, partial [Planctomycetota bacterium]
MTPYQKRVTAFTQRMAEDMQLRNLSPRTIDAYTYHVDRFAARYGKHPEELGPEQVRDFQLWMINELHSSWSQFNQAVCALRFFFTVTCQRDWVVRQIPYGHPHVHLMVPGSGPSLDGQRWVGCRMQWCRKTRRMRPFLVDNKELGREFRDLFLDRLKELVEQGKIQLEESGYLADLIGELRLQDWVAFIEGPPQPDCPPSVMLKYLTRYLTGGPISDRRIDYQRDGRIYFTARSKWKAEGPVEVSLSRVEFVQQWSLHILPKEFTKSRYFGLWSGSKRRKYMELCRALAPVAPSATKDEGDSPDTTAKPQLAKPQLAKPPRVKSCPHCQGAMPCIVNEPRPRWRELFYGPGHPAWYEWTSRGLCSVPDDVEVLDEILASLLE